MNLPTPAEAVLAIDPGNRKCGIAVVRQDGEILDHRVVGTEQVFEEVLALQKNYPLIALLIGEGTGSKPLLSAFKAEALPFPIHLVDETRTSEAARVRFVAENPPRGWQRLLPHSLRTPDRPYDDYAAIILAERFWKTKNTIE